MGKLRPEVKSVGERTRTGTAEQPNGYGGMPIRRGSDFAKASTDKTEFSSTLGLLKAIGISRSILNGFL